MMGVFGAAKLMEIERGWRREGKKGGEGRNALQRGGRGGRGEGGRVEEGDQRNELFRKVCCLT